MTIRRRGIRTATTALVMVGALIGAACSDGSDGASDSRTVDDAPTSTVSTSSLAAPDEQGPYAVGRTVLELSDADRSRDLVADVWYPASADAAGAPSIYQFLPGIEFASDLALADVAVSTDGPFPLVVYSHGSGGLRYVASFFTELLASHGFVVASVDHVGNTAVESITGTQPPRDQIAIDRVNDVEFLIDQMLDDSAASGGQFSGSIDPERIGVTGHSFGGFTALAAVGGYTNSLGSVAADERIDAVAVMAPATGLNAPSELEAVDVPTLLLSGTQDTTVPIDPDTVTAWELIPGRPLWRIDLDGAGHQSFTDVCDYQALLPTLGNVPQPLIDAVDEYAAEGCVPELMPIDQAHTLSNRALVSFLLAYVAGEDGYVRFLEDELPGETVSVRD
ncbi:MAG: alpha/beta hydrolase family protein [Microthrixaceae bacterium]